MGAESAELANYLREESPHARFERIAAALGSAGIDQLLRAAATVPPSKTGNAGARRMALLLKEISRLAVNVVIEPPRTGIELNPSR